MWPLELIGLGWRVSIFRVANPIAWCFVCLNLQCSWIDGRIVEPRCTFPVPPEHQLRHWLSRQSAMEQHQQQLQLASSPPSSTSPGREGGSSRSTADAAKGPKWLRIAWRRLHNLSAQPVYAVDNRSGEALDLFAIFNTIASSFVNVSLHPPPPP